MAERCVFFNRSLIEQIFGSVRNDPSPCSGLTSRHHIRYRKEAGSNKPENIISVCRGHQDRIHSMDMEWARRENPTEHSPVLTVLSDRFGYLTEGMMD